MAKHLFHNTRFFRSPFSFGRAFLNRRLFKVLFLSFCVFSLLSLTACSADTGYKSKTVPDRDTTFLTLALRSGIYADVIKKCLPAFEEKYNVLCEVEELSEDGLHSGVFEDTGQPKGKYDLCMVDGSWMAEYTEAGTLAELSALGYSLDRDVIPATTTICYAKDGGIYLAPFYGNVTVLLYNRALVEAAGYTGDDIDSMQDILQICKFARSKRYRGFMYRGDTANNIVVDFLPILRSFGGWVVDEDNRPSVDTREFKEALSFYLELIGTGEAAPKDELIAAIANQAAAMGVGWPGWYTPKKNSEADYCALTGKRDAAAHAFNANVYGIWAIGVPANSREKETAALLLSYLTDPDVQLSTIDDGGVPCRYSSLQDPDVLAEYTRCFSDKRTVHGICEDYRASATIDMKLDEPDRKKKIETPLLLLWGQNGVVGKLWDVMEKWRPLAAHIEGTAIPECGHFVPEEQPERVLKEMLPFMERHSKG